MTKPPLKTPMHLRPTYIEALKGLEVIRDDINPEEMAKEQIDWNGPVEQVLQPDPSTTPRPDGPGEENHIEFLKRHLKGPKPDGDGGEDEFVGPAVIDFAEALHIPIQPREWLDHHKLLRKNTAFQLNGDGGIGKTEIALQMQVGMCATGRMFKLPVERGTCLFVSFEEPENEIRWRIDHLAHAFDIPSASIKNLKIIDFTRERDPWLFKERDRELIPTNRWTWLLKEFEAIKPTFIVMDNKTRFFGANQNDAVLATSYAHHLELACTDLDTTIMPLAHVSLSQLQSGRGDSGSVAAGNAFRSRMLFRHADAMHEPDAEDKGDRKLVVMKANASPTGTDLDFKWHKGLEFFDCLYEPSKVDEIIGTPDKAERVFLKLLAVRINTDRPVSANENARNFAPKVFFENREGREGVNRREFERAMERLLQKSVIRQVEYNSYGHTRLKLDYNS